MSFTTKVKNELTTLKNTKSEALSLLSGFIRNNGYQKENKLYLTTENKNIATLLKEEIENNYNIKVETEKTKSHNLFQKKLILLKVTEKIDIILQDICYYDKEKKELEYPKSYLVASKEEIKSYLRGVFLSSGSINNPESSYHMELSIMKKEEAVFVQKELNEFDLNAKILGREKGYMIYLKEAEKISDYLKILGASRAVMDYENTRSYHETINQTNRLNNCEQANTDKIVATALKQLKQIEIIEENIDIETLDEKTRTAMTYRKKYPESSLKELSEIISLETGKTITKSGLNHRFRKIKEFAEKLTKSLDQ